MSRANRKTAQLQTEITPELLAKAKADGQAHGFKTLKSYLEALIEEGLPKGVVSRNPGSFKSAVPAITPALIGHRTVQALDALRDRIDAGEAVGTLEAGLEEIKRDVNDVLLMLQTEYHREVAEREEAIQFKTEEQRNRRFSPTPRLPKLKESDSIDLVSAIFQITQEKADAEGAK